jgi:hypothetical protein
MTGMKSGRPKAELVPLHADLRVLDQHGGALVRPAHATPDQARRSPQGARGSVTRHWEFEVIPRCGHPCPRQGRSVSRWSPPAHATALKPHEVARVAGVRTRLGHRGVTLPLDGSNRWPGFLASRLLQPMAEVSEGAVGTVGIIGSGEHAVGGLPPHTTRRITSDEQPSHTGLPSPSLHPACLQSIAPAPLSDLPVGG